MVLQRRRRARGFFQHRGKLPEHGRILVRAVVDLVADALGAEQARIRELAQFPVQRARRNPGEPRNHAHVETVARAQEKERQHAVAVGAEEQVREHLFGRNRLPFGHSHIRSHRSVLTIATIVAY